MVISFSTLGKFLIITSSDTFSCPLLLSPSGMPMVQMLGVLNIVPVVSEAVLIDFYSFFFSCSASFISTILYFSSLILSSASTTVLLLLFRVFLKAR